MRMQTGVRLSILESLKLYATLLLYLLRQSDICRLISSVIESVTSLSASQQDCVPNTALCLRAHVKTVTRVLTSRNWNQFALNVKANHVCMCTCMQRNK